MKYIFLLLLSILTLPNYAENVTEQKARELATQFLRTARGTRSSSVSLELVYNGKNTSTRSIGTSSPLYIYNNVSGKGFVIVSGDDAAMPILAYSDENNFRVENMPPNVRNWLEGYESEIRYIQQNQIKASPECTRAWQNATRAEDTYIAYLRTPYWDQVSPYNSECYKINGQHALAGCTNTAFASIMYYHQWPDCGLGELPSYSYKLNNQEYTVPGHRLGHTYDWKNMKFTYSPNSSADDVALLMRDCGVMFQAKYRIDGTGTSVRLISEMLSKHMKYDFSSRLEYKGSYTSYDWSRLLQKELDEKRPIFYTGQDGPNNDDPEDGEKEVIHAHAFVIDGYTQKGYFHVNWGWNGYCNGPYSLSALYPISNGEHVSHDYSVRQWAMINIKPNPIKDRIDLLSLSCSQEEFELNKPFQVSVAVKNVGTELYYPLSVDVVLTDKEGTIKEIVGNATSYNQLYPGEEAHFENQSEITCQITREIEEGDKLRLYHHRKGDGNYVSIVSPNQGKDYLNVKMKVYKEEMKFSGMTSSVAKFQTGVSFQITLTPIYNTGEVAYSDVFSLALTDSRGVIKEQLKVWEMTFILYPGYSYNPSLINPLDCIITQTIQNGDRIRLLFKSKTTGEWIPVGGLESDDVWEIRAITDATLGDQISFDYDKDTRIVSFGIPEGTVVNVTDDKKQDFSHLLKQDGTTCLLNLKLVSHQSSHLRFEFTRNDESVSFQVTLPDTYDF